MIIIEILTTLVFGWSLNAIINYLSDTLPENRTLTDPFCKTCSNKIPLVNYFLGRGCNYCHKKQTVRFWISLLLLILIFSVSLILTNNDLQKLLFNMVIFSFLLLVTVIDIEHHLILNQVSIAGAALFSLIGLIYHGWLSTILGGIVGFGIMLLLFLLGYFFSKIISKQRGIELEEGMGFGDVTLIGVCGFLLGWPGIIAGIVFAILLGGVWSFFLFIASKVNRKDNVLLKYIAYAPFITAATGILWIMR